MNQIRFAQLSRRLGGRSFLQTNLYGFAAIAAFFAGLATAFDATSPGVILLYSFANLISLIFAGLVFFALKWIQSLIARDFRLAEVIVAGALLGLAKTISTGWLVVVLGLESPASAYGSRAFSGVVIGVLLVLTLSTVSVMLENFQDNRALLIRESVGRQLSQSLDLVREEIAQDLRTLRARKLDAVSVADRLEELVNTKLRPFSRELWESAAKKYPEGKLSSLFEYGLKYCRFPITPFVLIYAIGSPGTKQVLAGDITGLLVVLIQVFGLVVTLTIANQIKVAGSPYLAIASASIGSALSMSVLPGLLSQGIAGYSVLLGAGAILLSSTFNLVMLTTAAAGLAIKRTQDIELSSRGQEQLLLESEGVTRLLAARRAAEILHGRVQNRFLAAAMRIGRGSDGEAELRDLAGSLEKLRLLPKETTVSELASTLSQDWSGVLELRWTVSNGVSALSFEIAEAIRESVTNAHRHGLASVVSIDISETDASTVVVVSDDGLGPREGGVGLGHTLLDHLGAWSLAARPEGGSKLEFTAPKISG